jgi:hypothetical protein
MRPMTVADCAGRIRAGLRSLTPTFSRAYAEQLIAAMKGKYPELAQEQFLVYAANAAFPGSANK